MSSASFRTVRRKIAPSFGDFTSTFGQENFYGPILCLAAQFLRWGVLLNAEKNGDNFLSQPLLFALVNCQPHLRKIAQKSPQPLS